MNLNSVLRAGAAVLLVGSVSLFSAGAHADMHDIRMSDNAVEVGVGAMHLNYKEKANGSILDSEKGWLSSAHLGATYLALDNAPVTNLYAHLDIDGSFGSTRYGGALQYADGTTVPWGSSTQDHVLSTDLQLGYAFPIGTSLMLTPYGEVGYRYWDRNLKGTGGYPEHYTNWEFMAGGLAQYSPIARWVFSLSGSVGTTAGGNLDAHLNGYDYSFQLGDHLIWRAQARVGFRVTERIELTATGSYESFGFDASPPSFGFYEPDSTTHQARVLVGLAYHFF